MIFDDHSKQKPAYGQKQAPTGAGPQSDFDKTMMLMVESLTESVFLSAMGSWDLLKNIFKHPILAVSFGAISFYFTRYIAWQGYHLHFLYSLVSDFVSPEKINWFYKFSLNTHHAFIFASLLFFICLVIGFRMRFLRTKFRKIFMTAGLTNGMQDTPKLLRQRKLDNYRTEYLFDANGIGISEFKNVTERLEAQFHLTIESIKFGKHQGHVAIVFNKHTMPEKVTYNEVEEAKVLPAESFYVGHSIEGIITQKIQDLPHMLIAGTTGSGKSVFFKQCLVGLLESCPYLQLYVIDLKGGLEAIDFKEAPNVKIVKVMADAVTLLRQVEIEMKQRFDFLEHNGLKQIVPGRDKKERIVVAIDEASVLYTARNRFDDGYETAMDARRLADSIAKLSRAAAIHLVFATQKLDKQIIPTSVSENISGRMAFRTNSFQGSNTVLGSKDASELPEVPGRGVWNVGNKNVIVQAPYISDSEIKNFCKRIKNEFEAGKRKKFNPLIGEKEKKLTNEARQSFDENNL